MRTFPKSLAFFRQIVDERGEKLRRQSFEDLKKLSSVETEHLIVDSRPSTISTYVQTRPDGSLRIVVQGFMKGRMLPVSNVALDGFYKYPDGRLGPMPEKEFYEFG